MAWTDARDALEAALNTVDALVDYEVVDVHITPPPSINDTAVHISIPPPGSETDRRASGVRRDTYEQAIYLQAHIAGGKASENDVIAKRLDDCRGQVNAVLDGKLQLGGEAVSVSTPSWEELGVIEYPSGSGSLIAQMVCTIEIEVEVLTTFAG